MPTNLNDLATFVRVAELGTFSAAAAAEGVPKSTISRRVARLEDALGVALLRRSARSFSLTADGQSLHARAAGAVRELANATDALVEGLGQPHGRLVVTAPFDVGTAPVVVDLLAEYRRRHPDVELEIRLLNRLVDLVAEGVDIALRAHASKVVPGDSALMTRNLGTVQAALYASPSYLKTRILPHVPEDFSCHAFVVHSTVWTEGQPITLTSEDGRSETLNLGRIACLGNSMYLVRAMVERGAGVGLLPAFATGVAVREGRLVRLLPEWRSRAGGLSLVWPSSRHLAARVRAFVELAAQQLTDARWMRFKDDW